MSAESLARWAMDAAKRGVVAVAIDEPGDSVRGDAGRCARVLAAQAAKLSMRWPVPSSDSGATSGGIRFRDLSPLALGRAADVLEPPATRWTHGRRYGFRSHADC